VDANSPWFGLGACTGRPGCASALADVQADARAAGLSARYAGRRVHFSGCERRCGRPHQVDLDLIATADGYRTVVES
jgi:precorrin-3B synthase